MVFMGEEGVVSSEHLTVNVIGMVGQLFGEMVSELENDYHEHLKIDD